MDQVDIANDLVTETVENALHRRQTLTIPFSGFCLNCEEPVDQRRYCDSFCRSEHEKQMKRRMRTS